MASQFVSVVPASEADLKLLLPHLQAYCAAFDLATEAMYAGALLAMAPLSHRPFGGKYAA